MFDLERFWAGGHEYFTEVIRSHGPGVRAICLSYGDSEDEVDDLLQGIWTLVYRKRQTYRGDGPFSAWLNRIATHFCIDEYRKRKAERMGMEHMAAKGGFEGIHPHPTDPSRELDRREEERALWAALDALPDKEREAIILRLIERRSPTEVAAEMKIEKASVRSNTSRGIKRLRGILKGGEA